MVAKLESICFGSKICVREAKMCLNSGKNIFFLFPSSEIFFRFNWETFSSLARPLNWWAAGLVWDHHRSEPEIPTLWSKKGRCHAHERRRREPLAGSGGMFPREKIKICAAKLAQSRGNPVHYHAQNYRRLMLGCQKGENGWESTEKRQRVALKRLVKQRGTAKDRANKTS